MKKQIFITCLLMTLGTMTGYIFSNTVEEEQYVVIEKTDQNFSKPSRIPASIKPIPINQEGQKSLGIIEQRLQNTAFSRMHKKVMSKFSNLDQKKELADWVIMGIAPDSSKEYNQKMYEIIDGLNQQPSEVLEAISKTYNQFTSQDSFIKTMLINTIHQLDVPAQDKIQFYGSRFSDEITLNKKNEFDINSMNITNAMAFAKQYKTDIEEIRPYILDSLQKSQDNKHIQTQLATRFKTYFSEMRDEIDYIISQ